MSSHFPPSGLFEDFPFHEMVVRLLRGRFSGSVEVVSGSSCRIMHFDSGNLCAATSDSPAEHLDGLLEQEFSTDLRGEQLRLVKEALKAGQNYGQALVGAGIIQASDLLTYNRNLAERIFVGALASGPERYRINPGKPGQYNPLPFNPLAKVRESLMTDVEEETVKRRLGGEEAVFVATEAWDRERSGLQEDAELQLLVSNLDGVRKVGELAGRRGMNADRSRRLLYFLKIGGWITPRGTAESAEEIEQPEAILGSAAAAADAYRALPGETADDSGEILKLLEEDYEPSQGEGGAAEPFEQSLSAQLADGERDKRPARKWWSALRLDLLLPPRVRRLLLILGPLAAVAVLLPVGIVLLLVEQPQPAVEGRGELSFYPADIDVSQLPLDEDFAEPRRTPSQALELPAEAPTEAEGAGATEGEEGDGGAQASPQATEPPAASGDEAQSDRPRAEEVSEAEFRSFDEVRPEALERALAQRWDEAARLWHQAVAAPGTEPYTLLIIGGANPNELYDLFQEIANSERLRDRFFIVPADTTGSYNACWGFFPDGEAALRALDALPARVQRYGPRAAPVALLMRAR